VASDQLHYWNQFASAFLVVVGVLHSESSSAEDRLNSLLLFSLGLGQRLY
jgi:hypothetical protein